MTLSELYQQIEGDYEQAMRVLRMEKLLDKYVKKFPDTGVIDALLRSQHSGDANAIFETAHAAKGVCANLGLVKLAALSSTVADEFRPGHARAMSDAELADTFCAIKELYGKTLDGIRCYTMS